MNLTDILVNENCLIQCTEAPVSGPGNVLLSFTGIGHAMGAIDVQKIEFVGVGRGFDNVIFITDLNRTWGNGLDFSEITAHLSPYIENKEVYAIGNSMGGFLSVLITNFISIKIAVAFAPQFSVSPNIVPDEPRWKKYRDEIEEFHYESLEGMFNDKTLYYLFSGGSKRERLHWQNFPQNMTNVKNIILDDSRHSVAGDLKKQVSLSEVISRCCEETFSVDWLSKASGLKVSQYC